MDNVHGGNVRRLYLVYFRINGKHLLVQNIFAEQCSNYLTLHVDNIKQQKWGRFDQGRFDLLPIHVPIKYVLNTKLQMYNELKYRGKKVVNLVRKYKEHFSYPQRHTTNI